MTYDSSELFKTLEELSVSIVQNRDSAVAIRPEDEPNVLGTRLVTREPAGTFGFALPVLQQWFAAQAIRSGRTSLDSVLESVDTFVGWSWPLVILLATSKTTECDALMHGIIQFDAGAGSWVLTQAAETGWSSNEGLHSESTATRWKAVCYSWSTGLGPVASLIDPRSPSNPPVLASITSSVDPNTNQQVWQIDALDILPSGDAWPWRCRQEQIAKGMAEVLAEPLPLTSCPGVWRDELRFARVCRMAGLTASLLTKVRRVEV